MGKEVFEKKPDVYLYGTELIYDSSFGGVEDMVLIDKSYSHYSLVERYK